MNRSSFLQLIKMTFSVPGIERAILKNLSLEVNPGDFLVVLGGNGSGKSSLMKCINGLYRPQSGMYCLNGLDMAKRSVESLAKSITTLTQDLNFSTFAEMTVYENCVIAALKHHAFPSKESIQNYLKTFHRALPKKLGERACSLSGGERQCLALAMCLYSTPELLLLDEHTSALDPKVANDIMEITQTQVTQRPKMSVMMTTHNLDDALKYGNRLIMLKEGEIILEASGKKKQQLTKPDLLAFY